MRKKVVFFCARKILLIIPYIFFMSLSDIFLSSPQDQPLVEILWYDIFGRLSAGNIQTLVMSIESLGVIFLFTILFGSHISIFFDSIGTYIFSRLPSRRIWISQKIIGLCAISIFYTIVYLALKFSISSRRVTVWQMDRQTLFTLVTLFAMLFPIFAAVCLLANWISIKHGLPIGILGVFVLILALELVAILNFDSPVNMILNPLCFNIDIIRSVKIALAKILSELVYLAILSIGITLYICRTDIF
ncbi:hypothetical protein [Intestinimonas massiliensis (ex Afouda et al. 2020)]|uniref:hypothetical protein n=1 Tax=Intestinimonas massiliensis (ex Afouda et al. 2020) TaxID=1673721 RepID=UPI00102F7523|nr:hypothetical protein [Intestinimonas massiliensis (ex Afouda et al. 2020)]